MPTLTERTIRMYLPVQFERVIIVTWEGLFVSCPFSFTLYDIMWWKKDLKWTKQLLFQFKSHTHKKRRLLELRYVNTDYLLTRVWTAAQGFHTHRWESTSESASEIYVKFLFLLETFYSSGNYQTEITFQQASAVFMEHSLTVVAILLYIFGMTSSCATVLHCFAFFFSQIQNADDVLISPLERFRKEQIGAVKVHTVRN